MICTFRGGRKHGKKLKERSAKRPHKLPTGLIPTTQDSSSCHVRDLSVQRDIRLICLPHEFAAGAKQQEDKTVLTNVLENVQANEQSAGKSSQAELQKQIQQEHEDGEADITLQQRMGLIASFHLLMLQV